MVCLRPRMYWLNPRLYCHNSMLRKCVCYLKPHRYCHNSMLNLHLYHRNGFEIVDIVILLMTQNTDIYFFIFFGMHAYSFLGILFLGFDHLTCHAVTRVDHPVMWFSPCPRLSCKTYIFWYAWHSLSVTYFIVYGLNTRQNILRILVLFIKVCFKLLR